MKNPQTCNYKVVWVIGATFTNKLMVNVMVFFAKMDVILVFLTQYVIVRCILHLQCFD